MNEEVENTGYLATCETLTDASGIPTLKLIGELDIGSVAPIHAAIDAIVADQPPRVVIDVSELRFIDSSGLALLLTAADRIAVVELREPSAMIRKLIDLTGLSSVFITTP